MAESLNQQKRSRGEEGFRNTLITTDRMNTTSFLEDGLAGLVVKASASREEDHGFESRLRWDFSGVESYQ